MAACKLTDARKLTQLIADIIQYVKFTALKIALKSTSFTYCVLITGDSLSQLRTGADGSNVPLKPVFQRKCLIGRHCLVVERATVLYPLSGRDAVHFYFRATLGVKEVLQSSKN